MSRTIRIVNYAINGSGVGHLVRLSAASRWIRRYCAYAGIRAEIYFLTSSEADGMLFRERFASFKLPSKTAVGESGIDKTAYLALAKQWVWHSLGLLRPDLLVVDTFPRGSFGELLSALDLCSRRAFVYRPMKESFASRADFQAMLPLYDSILVPDDPDSVEPGEVPVPDEARGRVVFTGPVMARERVETLGRDAARAALGVEGDRLAVYVSAGGGGDPGAERHLDETLRALGPDPGIHLVVGAGPLYRGREARGPRITWLAGTGAAELMGGLDAAVSASGYNSFFELMHAGVPAVFLPQEKVADEQDRRAARAAAAGAATILGRADAASIRAAVDALRDPARRREAAAAARSLVPRNNARVMAAELLRLVLPASTVEEAALAVGDGLVAASVELGLEPEGLFELGRALLPERDESRPGPALPAAEPAQVGEEAARIAREAAGLGLSFPQTLRLVRTMARRCGRGGIEERADSVLGLLRDLAAFEDWVGADQFMKALGPERELAAPELAAEVGAYLKLLGERGEDLYQGIARLCKAQGGAAAEVPDNRALLRGAAAALTRD